MTSNINPNNIDGAYPVAGQDNNSQGFRTNFTSTRTNFQFARDEITELQSKAVLKSALTGTTLDNNMQGSLLYNARLQQMSQTVVTQVSTTGSNIIDYSLGSYQIIESSTRSINLGFNNATWPATGYGVVRVQITISNPAHTLTLQSSVGFGLSRTSLQYIIGRAPSSQIITFTNPGTYVFEFSTTDGGISVFIQDLTRGSAASPSAA